MTLADPSVAPIVEALLACYEIEIAKVPSPPAGTCLRTGDRVDLLASLTQDECCSGLAWLRIASVYPSATLPEPDAEPSNCGPVQWAAVLELGAARCAPVGTDRTLPTCAEWLDVSRKVQADRAAMVRAVCCWAATTTRPYLFGAWEPIATEGGCTGGVLQVTVAAPFCECAATDDVVGVS